MNRRFYIALAALASVGILAPGFAQRPGPPARRAAEKQAATTPESDLWQKITGLSEPVPATQPYGAWFEAARQRRTALLGALRMYLTLYPGGVHRDDAIRVELQTLFELAMLRAEAPDGLRQRLEELLDRPPSEAVRHEAAYWAIICRRFEAAATSQPSHAPDREPDATRLVEFREYIERYSDSRYVPHLARIVFDDALRRGDRKLMRTLAEHLERHFPDHAATQALLGRLRLEEAVGQPFAIAFESTAGQAVDTRADFAGRPVLIVVWAGFDENARRCARDVERFRQAHPDVRVAGVSLDESAAATALACRETGIDWAQWNDGLGWGHTFVRQWGLSRIPQVLVLDRRGRLRGVAGPEGWRTLAEQALRRSAGAQDARDGG